MSDETTPILVGVGQVTDRQRALEELPGPVGLMQWAAEQAFDEAKIDRGRAAELDTVVVIRGFRESTPNSPASLTRRLGADRARGWLMPNGGNGPQYLVNRYAEAIARGENRFVLLAGAEARDSVRRLKKAGRPIDWSEPPDTEAGYLIPEPEMQSGYERAHGVFLAAHVYPLFENAYRHRLGRTIDEHQLEMGRLFARFSEVAAETPGAWFPVRRSAEEIATPSDANRFVGWPYTKFMNAMNNVDQSAAILMTSVGHARELGVPEDRFVYLHGCADTNEAMFVTDRPNFHESPAIRTLGRESLSMAGRSIDEIAHFDLYSCFPSAVEIARDELGIPEGDPRPLTVTGGLPYHGGAGNNYVMNAIVTMVQKLRAVPGDFGMVTANGGYLTKHAAGIYSTAPSPSLDGAGWARRDPAEYQAEIDALAHPPVIREAEGDAVIETYTVAYGRTGEPEAGILIGRMGDIDDLSAPRFVANTPADPDLLAAMTREDFVGRRGRVANTGKRNILRF